MTTYMISLYKPLNLWVIWGPGRAYPGLKASLVDGFTVGLGFRV